MSGDPDPRPPARVVDRDALAAARDEARAAPKEGESRCPRCEGYEATYHTFEGECAFQRPPDDELAARRTVSPEEGKDD